MEYKIIIQRLDKNDDWEDIFMELIGEDSKYLTTLHNIIKYINGYDKEPYNTGTSPTGRPSTC